MRALYPQLLTSGNNFEEKIPLSGGRGGGGGGSCITPNYILTLGAGLGASHDISS